MPNHVLQRVIVEGPKESIRDFKVSCFRHSTEEERRFGNEPLEVFDFSLVLPPPMFAHECIPAINAHKAGRSPDLWRRIMWGTRRDAYWIDIQEESDERLMFRFATANGFPTPIYRQLGLWFPELTFKVTYMIEGDNGWGMLTVKGEMPEIAALTQSVEQREDHLNSRFSLTEYTDRGESAEADQLYRELLLDLMGLDPDDEVPDEEYASEVAEEAKEIDDGASFKNQEQAQDTPASAFDKAGPCRLPGGDQRRSEAVARH